MLGSTLLCWLCPYNCSCRLNPLLISMALACIHCQIWSVLFSGQYFFICSLWWLFYQFYQLPPPRLQIIQQWLELTSWHLSDFDSRLCKCMLNVFHWISPLRLGLLFSHVSVHLWGRGGGVGVGIVVMWCILRKPEKARKELRVTERQIPLFEDLCKKGCDNKTTQHTRFIRLIYASVFNLCRMYPHLCLIFPTSLKQTHANQV